VGCSLGSVGGFFLDPQPVKQETSIKSANNRESSLTFIINSNLMFCVCTHCAVEFCAAHTDIIAVCSLYVNFIGVENKERFLCIFYKIKNSLQTVF